MRKALAILFLGSLFAPLAARSGDFEDDLALRLDRLRRRFALNRAIGVSVTRLSDGETLYAHNASRAFVPASGMKLVTMAAALHYLGSDYRFETRLVSDGSLEEGVLRGDLFVVGSGDPALGDFELDQVAAALSGLGIRAIEGSLLLDDRLFDDSERGDAAYQEALVHGRPTQSALAFNSNRVEFRFRAAQAVGATAIMRDLGSGYYAIDNRVKTAGKGRPWIRFIKSRRAQRLVAYGRVLWGSEEELAVGLLAPDAPLYLGSALVGKLRERGIEIRGGIRRGAADRPGLREIHVHRSATLIQILGLLGKNSDNFVAEQILKVLGAQRFGRPGSFETGARALSDYLTGLGLPPEEFHILDGSGLSYDNRVSPATLVKVLTELYRSQLRADFLCSLAFGGVDGTLRHRLLKEEHLGRVIAKTGSLAGISSLSGFAFSPTRGAMAFSILLNGIGKQWRGDYVEDEIARALLDP